MSDNYHAIPDGSNATGAIGRKEAISARDPIRLEIPRILIGRPFPGVCADPAAPGVWEDRHNSVFRASSILARELEEKTNKGGKILPAVDPGVSPMWYGWDPGRVSERSKPSADYPNNLQSDPVSLLPVVEEFGSLTSSATSSTLASPPAQVTTKNEYFGDVPRSASPLGPDDEDDKTAPADCHFSTRSAALQPLEQDIPLASQPDSSNNLHEDAGLCDPLAASVETQRSSHESMSMPKYYFFSPSAPDSASVHTVFRLETSNVTNMMAKDLEALCDNQGFRVANTSRTDPSIMVTVLIAALGLLGSHSSNPRVTVFQLTAAAVSFTLVALHTFHSNMLVNTEQHPTLVQRLLEYFPLLIFASCWVLFLLSITFVSPKIMAATVSLVVLASIPMVYGARLPAALTLALITFFGLTFFALVFLVCILPTEFLA